MTMKKLTSTLLAAAWAFSLSANASAPLKRPTEKCTTGLHPSIVMTLDSASMLASNIVDATRNPASFPELASSLWYPASVWDGLSSGGRRLFLQYDKPQDAEQIANSLKADPRFSAPEVISIDAGSPSSCIAFSPSPGPLTITEYYNAELGHYLLSTNQHENRFVDRGEWGPGWARTGETFQTYISRDCATNALPVHRHFGSNSKGPPSLFYTPKGEECGYLQNHAIGWTYFDTTFGAYLPVDGGCSAAQISVFRLYNNRWMSNDSNHRYTTKPVIYEAMQQQGWTGEGVAFCLPRI